MLEYFRNWLKKQWCRRGKCRLLTTKEIAKKYNAISRSWMYHLIHNDKDFAKCVVKVRKKYFINEKKFRIYLHNHWFKVEDMQ